MQEMFNSFNFSFGGTMATLVWKAPETKREKTAERRRWLRPEEYTNIVTYSFVARRPLL